MDKLFAAIQKTPMVQKIALVAFILVGMGVGQYFLVFQDQQDEIGRLDRDLVRLEDELHEKQEIANNLTKFKKKVEFLQQKLEEKKKNLPEDANLDMLLKTLNELAEKSDMRIIKFTPMPEAPRNFYAEIPVKMQIEGNYLEIATFFDKIAKEERIINISDIVMGDPDMKNGKVVLKTTCLAKTFKALPIEVKTGQPGAPGTPQ